MRDAPIASDDPQAAQKLTDRIAELEKLQATMAAANKIVRKHKTFGTDALSALVNIGLNQAQAIALFQPDYAGRIGFASYELTNNNANIRRLKERLATITEHANDVTTREELNGCTIIDNVEAFRVQIEFPGKPAENIREFLKGRGFKWAPSIGVWQRHRSGSALYYAREAVAMLEAPEAALARQFQGCVDSFRSEIYSLANVAGKDVLAVYALWRQYAKRCEEGDQSAVLFEFKQWYADQLKPVATIWNSDGIDEPALVCAPPPNFQAVG